MSELEAWGIEKRIFVIRGQRVMLDSDLAAIYGVPTKAINPGLLTWRILPSRNKEESR